MCQGLPSSSYDIAFLTLATVLLVVLSEAKDLVVTGQILWRERIHA